MAKLKRNAARCLSCGRVVESTYRHDYRQCKCGKIAVDGGLVYVKRRYPGGEPTEHFEELSEWEDE